ncbi:hypothetical protein V7266_21970 [Neobacillus drentensis]
MKDFHCCATCEYFRAEKKTEGINYYCSRLGYETKTYYKFNCWSPKEQVKKLLNKRNSGGI